MATSTYSTGRMAEATVYHPEEETGAALGEELFVTHGARGAESFAIALGQSGLSGYPLRALDPSVTREQAAERYSTYRSADGRTVVDSHRYDDANKGIVWTVSAEAPGSLPQAEQVRSIKNRFERLDEERVRVYRDHTLRGYLARRAFSAFGGLKRYEIESRGQWAGLSKRAQQRIAEAKAEQ